MFPGEDLVRDVAHYLEQNWIDLDSGETRGTPRRYLFAQAIKYLNQLNFYYVLFHLDGLKPQKIDENQYKAICYISILLVKILKKGVQWVNANFLRQVRINLKKEFSHALQQVKNANLPEFLKDKSRAIQLSIQYAHPSFFIERLLKFLPEPELEGIMQAHNSQRYLFFRIMKQTVDPLEIRQYFHFRKVPIKKVPDLPFVYRFSRRYIKKVVSSPPYERGDIALHDLASIYACVSLDPQPHEKILDVCAAPLMKSTLLQFLSHNECEIFSIDLSLTRMQNAKTISQASALTLLNADATQLPLRPIAQGAYFDKILVDAPCTSSGAIYYNPELKWRQDSNYLHAHVVLQKKLLHESLKQLRRGGLLVYSVCSYYQEEAEEIIQNLQDQVSILQTRRFFPHVDKCQGFFYAKLEKK